MLKSSVSALSRPLKRIPQITNSHCGPAVVQMLLQRIGVKITQPQIARAGGAQRTIKTHGMRVDQLARAVSRLVSQVTLWYKENARVTDIARLIEKWDYPVGVEWQGSFAAGEEDETGDKDPGHYSIVVKVNRRKKTVSLIDPYRVYKRRRTFYTADFVARWWDTNEIVRGETGKRIHKKDLHLLFVVTPNNAKFPLSLGLKKAKIRK